MKTTINLIINKLLLDALNPDHVDHIKVNMDFLEYLETNSADNLIYTKANKHRSNIVAKYKGMPLALSNLVTDYYEVKYKLDCGLGQMVSLSSARRDGGNDNGI